MRKYACITLAASTLALLGGCTSISENDGGTALRNPLAYNEVYKTKFNHSDQPVAAEDKLHVLFGFITWGSTADHIPDNVEQPEGPLPILSILPSPERTVRNGAYANACSACDADALINARYSLKTTDWLIYKKVSCDVIGYPATMTGIEKVPGLLSDPVTREVFPSQK